MTMRAPPTPPMVTPTMAPPSMMMMRARPPLLNIHPLLLLRSVIPMRPGQNGGNEKEDAVHNPKRKSSLQHRASLVNAHIQTVYGRGPEDSKRDVVARSAGDTGAVCAGDEPEVVNACYEGTHETQIDEAYEARVMGGSVVREKCEEGPG